MLQQKSIILYHIVYYIWFIYNISQHYYFKQIVSTKNIKQLFSTLMIIIIIKAFSAGSCDTKDWSSDAENSALHHRNKLHFKNIFKYKTVLLTLNYISQYSNFYCIFNQINAALVSIRDFEKH